MKILKSENLPQSGKRTCYFSDNGMRDEAAFEDNRERMTLSRSLSVTIAMIAVKVSLVMCGAQFQSLPEPHKSPRKTELQY